MLSVQDLSKHFPTPTEPLRVLQHIQLEMQAGENLSIVGPSGCGKSTLLHIIGTLDFPTEGTVMLDGCNPFELPPKQLAEYRNQNIGFVFQEHYLLPQLTAIENVLVPGLAKGSANDELIQRGKQLLDRVGLAERSEHRPAEMSGGERQRVAIARALILKPQILLADEPTGNLDQDTATQVGKMLIDIQQQEETMLICVTHSSDLAAKFSRTVRLDHGKLVETTSASDSVSPGA